MINVALSLTHTTDTHTTDTHTTATHTATTYYTTHRTPHTLDVARWPSLLHLELVCHHHTANQHTCSSSTAFFTPTSACHSKNRFPAKNGYFCYIDAM